MRDSRLVPLSASLYRLLLYLYPPSFRGEFGREMSLAFRDYCRLVAMRNGLFGLLQLWLTTIVDLIATAFVERLKEITQMSQSTIVRICGASGAFGGLYLLIIGITGLVENTYDNILTPLIPIYALALAIGVIGLFLTSKTPTAGSKLGLGLAITGTILMVLGLILMVWLNMDGGWTIWMGGQLLHVLGLLIFGLAAQELPPLWRAVPSVIGALSLLLFFVVSSNESQALGGVWFLFQGFGWILLGVMVIAGIKTHPTGPHPAIGT